MTATEPVDLGDWTDHEMWKAIHEAVIQHANPAPAGPGVFRARCGLCDDWKTNPRGSAESVVNDLIQHAVDTHAALVRKTIRQIQRRARLAGAEEGRT